MLEIGSDKLGNKLVSSRKIIHRNSMALLGRPLVGSNYDDDNIEEGGAKERISWQVVGGCGGLGGSSDKRSRLCHGCRQNLQFQCFFPRLLSDHDVLECYISTVYALYPGMS